jgi:hypothetical protein
MHGFHPPGRLRSHGSGNRNLAVRLGSDGNGSVLVRLRSDGDAAGDQPLPIGSDGNGADCSRSASIAAPQFAVPAAVAAAAASSGAAVTPAVRRIGASPALARCRSEGSGR